MKKINEKNLEKDIDIKKNRDATENDTDIYEISEEEDSNNITKITTKDDIDNISEILEEEKNNNLVKTFQDLEVSANEHIDNTLKNEIDNIIHDVPETSKKKINSILSETDKEELTNNTIISNDETSQKKDTENIYHTETDKKNIVNNKKCIKILIPVIGIILIFIAFLFCTIFALVNVNKTTIISGISIKGIDISGLTKEDAYNKVENIINEKLSKTFNLVYDNTSTSVSGEQFEFNFDINTSINKAYNIGRTGNIFENNFTILSCLINKNNIIPTFSYNEDAINSLALEIGANIPNKLIEPSYYIENGNLVISNGVNGVTIDTELLKLNIITYINDFNVNYENVNIPVVNCTAKNINIDTIYSEIYKEAKDAYYTKNPFTIYPHADGLDFAISLDEAKQLLKEQKESYVIPLKIIKPNITTNQIGTDAFPDLLATFSTSYSTRNVNRTTNIKLASSKIDGIVIMPGETFSYNTTVGKRTAEAGFKSAAVYAGGEVTTGIGGGICQVSSTLYNSVLLSNLEIVERHNHGFNPGYVKAGTDATVSWGGPDFKFKNNRSYPIKVLCTNSNGTITTTIFGLKEENDYQVEIEAYVTSYIPYKTITKPTSSLKVGQTKVIESGSNGCNTVSYKILKQNGKVVSKTLLSQDTYNPHNRIVQVGTRK